MSINLFAQNDSGKTENTNADILESGTFAPSFVLPDLKNNYVFMRDFCGEKLRKSYKNKTHHVMVLSFFASWCVPCKAEIPHLNNVYEKYKEKAVKFYLINVGEDKTKVNSFLEKNETSIPVLIDRFKNASFKYKATTLPRLVVLDKYGKVRKYKVGFKNSENFEQELEELIDSLLDE